MNFRKSSEGGGGGGWWVKSVLLSYVSCSDFSLFNYSEKTLLYHFHAKKALFKSPNFAT